MSKADQVNDFFNCDDGGEGQQVEFGDLTLTVKEASIGDIEEAEKIAGRGASDQRQGLALIICCTYDKEGKERFFDKTHLARFVQARGELQRRLKALGQAINRANEVEGN